MDLTGFQRRAEIILAPSPDFSPRLRKGGALAVAEKLESAVILRSSGDEESRIALKILRARSFAALRMTALEGFSAACLAPPSQGRPDYFQVSHPAQFATASCPGRGTNRGRVRGRSESLYPSRALALSCRSVHAHMGLRCAGRRNPSPPALRSPLSQKERAGFLKLALITLLPGSPWEPPLLRVYLDKLSRLVVGRAGGGVLSLPWANT